MSGEAKVAEDMFAVVRMNEDEHRRTTTARQ